MNMKKVHFLLPALGLILTVTSMGHAAPIPIDLTTFYGDPTVDVALDGNSATISEDPDLITVLLSSDPFLGGPGIPVPPELATLEFGYAFTQGQDDVNNFYAKVFDGASGTILKDFLIESTGSGMVVWDMRGLDPGITLLGLEFQLNAYDDDAAYDATAVVSNVQMTVPEPGTIALLALALTGLMGLRRKGFHGFRW
jgi:hypothetical protein